MDVCIAVLTEAISAIAGEQVKLHTHIDDKDKAWKLDVTSLLAFSLLGHRPHRLSALKTATAQGNESAESQRKEIFMIPEEFLDPAFDFDFTNKSGPDDGCMRGGEPYQRPYGWKRFAFNVLNKYPDGNQWLGADEWRSCSSPGEWPVCYYGASLEVGEVIIKSPYDERLYESYGNGKLYERGVYSSPDITMTNKYCKRFTSKKNGKTYDVILQCRINPEKRKALLKNKVWLVKVPEGTSTVRERAIVDSAIRPYGLLLQEVKK